jgi:trk system potassium uptake protein TrkA
VVVIERDMEICEQVASKMGAVVINGTGTSIDTLEEAGIEKADVAIGALPTDGDNLAFVILARNFKVPRIMARMRNPRYETAYKLAGASRCINITGFFVEQLVLEIEQPAFHEVVSFGGGKASIVVVTVPEGSIAHGQTIRDIAQSEGFPTECVIAGIFRKGADEFIFRRGDAQVCSGDQVFLAAEAADVRKAAHFLQKTK